MSVSAPVNSNISNILNPPDLSLTQLVLHADPIVQAALVLLLLLSIWSWSIMVEKAFEVMRAKHAVKKLEAAVREGAGAEAAAERVKHPAGAVLRAGVQEWQSPPAGVHEALSEQRDRIERVMRNELAGEMRRLELRL